MSGRGAVALFLAGKGRGAPGETIWTGWQPEYPAYPAITVARYGGASIDTFGTSEQNPLMQVYITGELDRDDEAEALADACWQDLADSGPFTLDGTAISAVTMNNQAVLPLGRDGTGRPMYSFNISVFYA